MTTCYLSQFTIELVTYLTRSLRDDNAFGAREFAWGNLPVKVLVKHGRYDSELANVGGCHPPLLCLVGDAHKITGLIGKILHCAEPSFRMTKSWKFERCFE
jgi:hypothetical protein